MLTAGEGDAGGDAKLFSEGLSEGRAELTLLGDSLLDQVIVFRLPTRETRLSRATNVAMATNVATNATISRVRGCQAHFILLIYTGRAGLRGRCFMPGRNHISNVLIAQHVAFGFADLNAQPTQGILRPA